MPRETIIAAPLKISDGRARISHVVLLLVPNRFLFTRIFSVDVVMCRYRSPNWVLISAYGLAVEEKEPVTKGWAGGEVRAEECLAHILYNCYCIPTFIL